VKLADRGLGNTSVEINKGLDFIVSQTCSVALIEYTFDQTDTSLQSTGGNHVNRLTLFVHGALANQLSLQSSLQTDVVHQFAVRIPLEEIVGSCTNRVMADEFQRSVENLPFPEDMNEPSVAVMSTGARTSPSVDFSARDYKVLLMQMLYH
jgi:hypothetical protein